MTVNVVDQRDNPPVFANSAFAVNISEDAVIGTEIVIVEAVSLDSTDVQLKYRIIDSSPDLPFQIESETGIKSFNLNFF